MKRSLENIEQNLNKKQKIDLTLKSVSADSFSRLRDDFFNQDCLTLSKKLLGKYLIRKLENNQESCLIVTRIVEVEAYTGGNDQASHSFNQKQTARNKAMFMKAGTCYVYNIYGCYCCLNISSQEQGAAVLIRAVEPIYGIDLINKNREKSNKRKNKKVNHKNLTNGPSKLCMGLNITKDSFDQIDLATSENLWLQENSEYDDNFCILSAKRIGIDYAGEEAINKLWRFYIKDNKFVSVLSKETTEISI